MKLTKIHVLQLRRYTAQEPCIMLQTGSFDFQNFAYTSPAGMLQTIALSGFQEHGYSYSL